MDTSTGTDDESTPATAARTAGPGPSRPDEPLSLHEAVASGSPSLVEALLEHPVRSRYSEAELLEARDVALHWYETGAEAELRRRTGTEGPLARTSVQDETYVIGELTLAGTSVRDGHAAILTILEGLLGIRVPFEELMARALPFDRDHSAWGSATILLAHRRDQETWAAAAALRTHPEPSHRQFGAEVLRLTHLFDDDEADTFAGPALDIFTAWSTREPDRLVLAEVLRALGEHADARANAALLPYAGHPDGEVRRAVASGLGTWFEAPAFSDEVREALLVLMTDADTAVRQDACYTVGNSRDRAPGLADAMFALLEDADRRVRVTAVEGLAFHDDERCVEAARRLGPPQQPGSHTVECHLDALWLYKQRRDGWP
ncbi:HEAT repeat domain-containing protein [Streptomyces sp. NPDC005406]|uniref:HEAT repeat domain-containing protein n=1 Tax=Streptomyces sp. NPDC005406 TaxID=3155339 RepID=UPI003452A7E4